MLVTFRRSGFVTIIFQMLLMFLQNLGLQEAFETADR